MLLKKRKKNNYSNENKKNIVSKFRIVENCGGRTIHPGSVQSIVQHPTNEDKILIGYKNTLIVHWDLPSNSHDRTYIYKQVCLIDFFLYH